MASAWRGRRVVTIGREAQGEDVAEVMELLHHFSGGEPAHGADATVLLAGLDPDRHDLAAERPDTLAGKLDEQPELALDEGTGDHARGGELVLEAPGPVGDHCVPGLGDDPAGCQQRRLRCAQGVSP